MTLHQFLLILLARKKIIVATLVLTLLATASYSLLVAKTYKAAASVLLNYKGVDPLTGLTMPGQLLPGYMATQIDIISSKNVALRVVDALRLADSPAVLAQFRQAAEGRGTVQDWLAELLLKKLEIVPSRESSVVEISFKGSDPAFVAAVANAFADEYQKISVQLKTEPMKKTSLYFNEQTKLLRDNVEAAQARLSKYQQEKGIVSLDNNRIDIELSRLADLSQQLVLAQSQAIEADSRQRAARAGDGSSPDVANNALVQNLRVGLAGAEARFAELGQRLARNHPQYQSTRAEVEKMRADYRAALGSVSHSVGRNAEVLRQREAELRSALAAQKTHVLELNRARDEFGVLLKDVDSAQHAFDAASQRYSQTKIEAQSEQSDISILNPASAPIMPASPRLVFNILLALFGGSVLGVGLGLLAEMLRRPVRSAGDLAELAGIPVLGSVTWAAPPGRVATLLASRRPRLR
ncbi:MAG: chain length determinant protein EpsF [Pseudomonadota bacterium]